MDDTLVRHLQIASAKSIRDIYLCVHHIQREFGVYWYLFSNHCSRRCIYVKRSQDVVMESIARPLGCQNRTDKVFASWYGMCVWVCPQEYWCSAFLFSSQRASDHGHDS